MLVRQRKRKNMRYVKSCFHRLHVFLRRKFCITLHNLW